MKYIVYLLTVVSLFVIIVSNLFGTVLASKTAKILKDDIELALHDAGLQLDLEFLSNGYIVFSPQAQQLFESSFYSYNVSFYKHERELIEFVVFDDSNTTFPITYKDQTILYPTILATVKTIGNGAVLGAREIVLVRTGAYTVYREY